VINYNAQKTCFFHNLHMETGMQMYAVYALFCELSDSTCYSNLAIFPACILWSHCKLWI